MISTQLTEPSSKRVLNPTINADTDHTAFAHCTALLRERRVRGQAVVGNRSRGSREVG